MTEYYDKPDEDKAPDWQDKVCEQVFDEWDKGKQFVDDLNDMYDDIYRMLRGERVEKGYDWQSNLTLRKAFQVVWTAISYISQKVWGANPIIGVNGFNSKGCWQRERLLEVWMAEDKYFLTLVLGLLRLLLNGIVFIKKGWRQNLRNVKTGKMTMPVWTSGGEIAYQSETEIRWTEPIEDRPDDTILNNKDVVVDWMLKPGQDVREGRFILHREVLDIASLYASKINYMNLENIELGNLQGTEEAGDHGRSRQKDGQDNPPESEMYAETEIFERQGLWPVKVKKNGEIIPIFDKEEIYKEDTEWRFMWAAVANRRAPVLIRWEENGYGEMNILAAHLYYDPERWHSMGIVEPAKDVFTAQDDNLNAMFDEIWKNIMPPVMMNKYAVQDWDTIKWAPSQVWLMQGNPNDSVMIPRGTEITRDAWQKHALLEQEHRIITSVTPPIQGMGKEQTATQGVLSAQFSTGKLDFIIKIIEQTWLIPSCEMTMRFAQKFAHPLTFISILGEYFRFDKFQDEYKFKPAASSVKLPEQKEVEVQQDIQLMQLIGSYNNPNTPKIMNYLLANILRNRNKPQLAEMFDEEFFEASTPGGDMQMMNRMIGQGATSNQNNVPMSLPERTMRSRTFEEAA